MKCWAGSVLGVAALLSGCASHDPPTIVHAEQCGPLSGAAPATISATVPADGLLRARVRPDGVSILATLGGERARSPIDRYGSVTLVRRVQAGETVTLTAASRDSPEIVGEACLSLALLAPANVEAIRAEQTLASAARSVEANDVARAFALYLQAARDFDGLDAFRAAEARHAMAELANLILARQDDAFWLARAAQAGYGDHPSAGLMSRLLTVEAGALLETDRFTANERRTRALELLDEAHEWAGGDRFGARETPRIEILRGFIDYRAGHNAQATARFEKAASQCEQLKDWECYARALQNHAALAEEARDYTEALQAFANVLRVLPPDLDRQLTADIWGNQGAVQVSARLFDQGERSHRIAIRLHAGIGDCAGARVGISRLGSLLVQVGSLADGVSALSEATSLDCPALLAAAKSGVGEADAPRGPVCTGTLQPDTLDASGKFAMFHALIGLREALESESRPSEARRCLRSAAAYASTARTRLRLANAQAESLIQQGKPQDAMETFERGLANADQEGIPETQENRAGAYLGMANAALAEGKPTKARSYAHRSLLLGSTRADMGQIVDSLQVLARTFSGSAETDQALDVLRTAAALAEQVPLAGLDAEKRATWLASQHAVFAEMTRLFATGAADESRAWQAFEASERGRSRSLRYAVSGSGVADRADEAEAERFRQLMQRISALAQSTQSSEVPQISLDALAKIAHTTATPETESRSLLQQKLASLNASAIEYAAGGNEMYAFVIAADGISVTRLGTTQEIAAAADGLYDRLRNRESAYSDVQRAAAKLAQLVLWPVSAKLTHPRVIVVPDDSLHTVPFSILPSSPDAGAPLLVERAELSVVPSTLFLTHPRSATARRGGSPRLELIGDPVFQASRWERECAEQSSAPLAQPVAMNRRALPGLPGSRKEVLAIEQLAEKASAAIRVSTRLGCEATPSALRAAAAVAPDLLHIATHGYVDAYRPRLSALALTQDLPADGGASTVGLLDILDMHIGSKLVVLSACDTSRGRLLPGEGVLGPAQAFLQAGAASVVASYWRIPDEHTAPFMETFYRYLLVDRLSAAAALRQTQRDYARDRASLDWAAFTLYGWPDTTL